MKGHVIWRLDEDATFSKAWEFDPYRHGLAVQAQASIGDLLRLRASPHVGDLGLDYEVGELEKRIAPPHRGGAPCHLCPHAERLRARSPDP